MSTWLVDTHALLWFLAGDGRLSSAAREVIEDPDASVLVSTASLWEIAIKRSLGKLTAPDDLPDQLDRLGFLVLEIGRDHAWNVRDLPVGDHRDPFDRLLASQALRDGLRVISGDAELDQYGVERHW